MYANPADLNPGLFRKCKIEKKFDRKTRLRRSMCKRIKE